MTHTVQSSNIRALRSGRHWSQEELAAASGVDVRTVQRAEAGQPISLESQKAIAAAFDVTVDTLSISAAELSALIAEITKNFSFIDVVVPTQSSELGDRLGIADAYMVHRIGAFTEQQLDDVSELEELVRDWGDIWQDLTISHRRDAEQSLFEKVTQLRTSGISLSVGIENAAFVAPNGVNLTWRIFHLAAVVGGLPLLTLARDKRARLL